MRYVVLLFALLLPAGAEPIATGAVTVVDGDTIRANGTTYRLVGFDTPETFRAKCADERALGNDATRRLRVLVAGGGVDLQPVACACRPGTAGTMACNYGRACGVLRVRGRNVADIMIQEGLALEYVCRGYTCPKREKWCG